MIIQMSEYANRRQNLLNQLGQNEIIIVPSAQEIIRNGDAVYPFRQDSDFFYLTGFDEPEAVLVLFKQNNKPHYILFNRVRDRAREIWDGPRVGQLGACEHYLADVSYPIENFTTMLPDLIAGKDAVYFPLGKTFSFDQTIASALQTLKASVRRGVQAPSAFIDVSPLIHEMRLLKSDAEIALMQKAIDITQLAHVRAMQICKPGLYEYQLESELHKTFQYHGARFPAYGTIVGAGKNSCVLHYVQNNAQIQDNDIVLIDAGAEYNYYAADITRTFPANGKFSAEQKEIYNLVLATQTAAIAALKPGVIWTKAQEIIVDVMIDGLLDLKILKGSKEELIAKEAYFDFYMHRSGHYLGLDVHDAGQYKRDGKWRNLQAGMVFTVEPGIYISKDIEGVDPRWHNIGVRIEDNVLITKDSAKVLSAKIPKTIADVEETMAS